MSDPTAYWLKRTRRIIKDLDEALEACAQLDILEDATIDLERVLERLEATQRTLEV